jgi:Tol biopolymer transport system component
MAPEQVEGLDTDSRVDVWAFGAILHEMITGRAAFEARTPATLIAAVLTQKPQAVPAVNPEAPAALERLIAGCLEKDREQRWQSIRDVKRQLAAVTTPDEPGDTAAAPLSPVPARRSSLWVGTIGGSILGIVLGGAIASRIAGRSGGESVSAPLVRFEIRPPAGTNILHTDDTAQYIAPSPDGTRVAFTAGGRLWIKALNHAAAEEVAGAGGASSPFWSPDGRSIGFFTDRQLKKKVLDGGPPETLCAISGTGNNGTWNAGGVILFDDWNKRGLLRISADGGSPTVVGDTTTNVGWPQFLPDGRHYLYVVARENGNLQAFVGALDSADTTELPGVNSRVEYAGGHLLFRRDGALLAQPFDPGSLELSGSAVTLAEFVVGFASTGFAAFSAGGSNLLLYQAIAPANRLVWVDREGREGETIAPPRDYNTVRLSPDGRALAVSVRDQQLGTNDIWIHDFRRNIDTRLTSEKQSENGPVWSPDGRTIVYSADRNGPPHVHARDASGSAERMVTVPSKDVQVTTAVTPDGRMVIYSDSGPDTGRDVMMAPIDGTGSPVPLVRTKALDSGGRPSPDGRWLAYTSTESGRAEVYVRPFRDDQTRWQVSRASGNNAKWRGDGRELFYVEGGARIMSVDVSPGAAFDVSAPRVLFSRQAFADYDVTVDGKKFVFVMLDPEAEAGTLNAVLNWTALLRK